MLIEFRVENYRSLRDEQILSLEAYRQSEGDTDPRCRSIEGHESPLLTAAVLYGANASGKSNVLSAIEYMRSAVLNSHRLWDPESGIPRHPFGWGRSRKEPSTFEITFVLQGCKHEYGFVVSDDAVLEEWLYAYPKGRKQSWFERENNSFKFGEHLKGARNDVMKEVTRPNALFLSVASQHGHTQLSPVYSWFRRITPLNIQGSRFGRFPYRRFRPLRQLSLFDDDQEDEKSRLDIIRQLLKAADTGIVDVKEDEQKLKIDDQEIVHSRFLFKHQEDNEDSWLDLDQESEGTKTLFRMASPIFSTLESGGVLIVDELEASLHPLIGLNIVRIFNCPQTNSHNAQIVFSTHDTNLLGTTLGDPPLRRDQIWFTEKGKDGSSILYPLTDYKPRKSENLERGYLQGRYGAVPFLGEISWDTESPKNEKT